MNKKIQNATPNTYDGISFKSKMEATVYKTFKENGYTLNYEKCTVVLWAGFKPTVPFFSFTKKGKFLELQKSKLRDITYTPDFTIEVNEHLTVFIEVKGFENDIFPIKKKLFRKYLEDNYTYEGMTALFFEVKNKRQALQAIDIIKDYENTCRKNEGTE